MSFMKKQAARLLRGKFKDQLLAEEVYAIFATDEVIEADSPVKIGPTGESVPPLTIINNPSRTPIPPIVIGEGGPEVTPAEIPEDLEPFTPSDTPSGGGGMFSAQVGSQASGVNYNCVLYPGGTAAVVEMKNLTGTAVLPAGIWVPAVLVGSGQYHGFPNVFYGPGS